MPSLDYYDDWKLEEKGRYVYFDGVIEKGENDNSKHRLIKLVENDLVVLLVQDEKTDFASAAMDINAGSIHDPPEIQGLAHFIEHLVFMGTKKFPKENGFDSYLSAHSGSSNASTGIDSTNYYFDVGHRYLEGALDRFAQLFISPLFSEDAIQREVEAVDSEYKKHAQSDAWRIPQLQKSLCNPKHPYSLFNIGTAESLVKGPTKNGLNIRDEVEKFFKSYYSANIMKLCILGKEPLDKLADWAHEYFKDIPNNNVELPNFSDRPPVTEDQLKKQVFVKPVEDGSSLRLWFPFPDYQPINKQKNPYGYIYYLLNHEGPGSLQSYLKRNGWVNYVSSGMISIGPIHCILSVYFSLSKEGAQQYQQVIKAFFSYVELIKDRGVQKKLFDDRQAISSMYFRFQDKASASGTTSYYSSILHYGYTPERLISGPNVPLEFDSDLIKQHLAKIRTDNFSLFLICEDPPNGIKFTQTERWFGAEYTILNFDKPFIQFLNTTEMIDKLTIPGPNLYLPTNFDISKQAVPEPARKPDLIENSRFIRHWHKKDDTFWTPRITYSLLLRTPLAYSSVSNNLKTRLYCALVYDALMEATYDAREVGLYYFIQPHPEGVVIMFGGFKQPLPLLVKKFMYTVRNLRVDPDRFSLIKNEERETLNNFSTQEPQGLASTFLTYCTIRTMWTDLDRLRELEQITAQDIQEFYPTLFSQFHLELLAHGNVTRQESLETIHSVLEILKPEEHIPVENLPREQSLELPEGTRNIYKRAGEDPKNVNSAIDYLIQVCRVTDAPLRNRLKLLRQVIHERFYNQLRTTEQLGYYVSCSYYTDAGSMGLEFCVQSERTTEFLERRVETFVQSIREFVLEMDQDTYGNHVQSLITIRQQKPNSLGEEGQTYWDELIAGYYDFTEVDVDIQQLRLITKEDLLAFVDEYIDLRSPRTRKLSIHIQAHKKSREDILYKCLVDEGIQNISKDDLRTIFRDEGISGGERSSDSEDTIEDEAHSKLRQLLTNKCGDNSVLIDRVMLKAVEALDSLKQEQSVDELFIGEESAVSDLLPSELITDLEDFKSKLIVNPPASPVTDLIVSTDT